MNDIHRGYAPHKICLHSWKTHPRGRQRWLELAAGAITSGILLVGRGRGICIGSSSPFCCSRIHSTSSRAPSSPLINSSQFIKCASSTTSAKISRFTANCWRFYLLGHSRRKLPAEYQTTSLINFHDENP